MKRILGIALLIACLFGLSAQAQAITRGNFAAELTRGIGGEVTLHVRRAWEAQMQAEQSCKDAGSGARNNPFNTTQRWPGSWSFNSIGVQNYASGADGVAATVKTLGYKGHGYGWIIQAVRRNYSADRILGAIGRSDWGTFGPLALAVLSDIKAHRAPNTLAQLEACQIAG